MGSKGEGKSPGKDKKASKALRSRQKQDALALAPRVPLYDPSSHEPLKEGAARVEDSKTLREVLKLMTTLSPMSLSVGIKTAESLIKPPALAVIDARRAALTPRTTPASSSAKTKGKEEKEGKDGLIVPNFCCR